jgi:hypothetical protein
MTRSRLCIAAATAAWLSLGTVVPQTLPDFSGRWTSDADPARGTPPPAGGQPAARGDMGSGWGPTITIAQQAQLVVEYAFFGRGDMQPPLKFVYALDGSETRNTVMMGRGTEAQVSRAVWEGQTLAITTSFAFTDPSSGKPVTTEMTRRLTLESPTSLVVEVTRAGVLGGKPSVTKTTYRKI